MCKGEGCKGAHNDPLVRGRVPLVNVNRDKFSTKVFESCGEITHVPFR